MKKSLFIILLFFSVLNARADFAFETSGVERRYFEATVDELMAGLISRGIPAKLSEERSIPPGEAKKVVREMAGLVAICSILGFRLYEPDFKAEIARIISNGGTATDIKKQMKEFLDKKIIEQKIDKDDPLAPVIAGTEFASNCIDAAGEDAIQNR